MFTSQNLEIGLSIALCVLIPFALFKGRKLIGVLKELKAIQPEMISLTERLDAATDDAKKNIETLHAQVKNGGKKLSDALNLAGITTQDLSDLKDSAKQSEISLEKAEDRCRDTLKTLNEALVKSDDVSKTLFQAIDKAEKARAEETLHADSRSLGEEALHLEDDKETAPKSSGDIPGITPFSEDEAVSIHQDAPAVSDAPVLHEDQASTSEAEAEEPVEKQEEHGVEQPTDTIQADDAVITQEPPEAEAAIEPKPSSGFSDVIPAVDIPALTRPRPYMTGSIQN